MATTFETVQTAARVYAAAMLELADERGLLDTVQSQFGELMALWRSDASFAPLMESAAIDDDARRASLRRVFTGRVHELVLNLLLVLNDKGRTMLFPHVVDAFQRMLDEKLGRRRVYVASAVELTDAHRARLVDIARRLVGREPVLVERVDPRLLGGLVIQAGDRVVDRSVRLKLRRMRRTLLGQMERHIHDRAHRFIVDASEGADAAGTASHEKDRFG